MFDINATEFFRQADDAKKKPLTAHECRSVINTFLDELFSVRVLRDNALQVKSLLTRKQRTEAINQLTKFSKNGITLDELRIAMVRITGDLALGYRLVNIARALTHAR